MNDETERRGRMARVLIIATVLIWATFDLWRFIKWGGPATISTQIGNWLASGRCIGFLIGGVLAGLPTHLYRMIPSDTSLDQRLWVVAGMLIGSILMWFLTPQ